MKSVKELDSECNEMWRALDKLELRGERGSAEHYNLLLKLQAKCKERVEVSGLYIIGGSLKAGAL